MEKLITSLKSFIAISFEIKNVLFKSALKFKRDENDTKLNIYSRPLFLSGKAAQKNFFQATFDCEKNASLAPKSSRCSFLLRQHYANMVFLLSHREYSVSIQAHYVFSLVNFLTSPLWFLMTKSAKFHPSMHQNWSTVYNNIIICRKTQRIWEVCDVYEMAQSWILLRVKVYFIPSPVETQNMSAGKLIYFHYAVLLCLSSVQYFFNIHFHEQHFVFQIQ